MAVTGEKMQGNKDQIQIEIREKGEVFRISPLNGEPTISFTSLVDGQCQDDTGDGVGEYIWFIEIPDVSTSAEIKYLKEMLDSLTRAKGIQILAKDQETKRELKGDRAKRQELGLLLKCLTEVEIMWGNRKIAVKLFFNNPDKGIDWSAIMVK